MLEDIMKDNQNKPDMKRYDYLGLVGQLVKSEEDQMYLLDRKSVV